MIRSQPFKAHRMAARSNPRADATPSLIKPGVPGDYQNNYDGGE